MYKILEGNKPGQIFCTRETARDENIRFYSASIGRIIQVVEQIHTEKINLYNLILDEVTECEKSQISFVGYKKEACNANAGFQRSIARSCSSPSCIDRSYEKDG